MPSSAALSRATTATSTSGTSASTSASTLRKRPSPTLPPPRVPKDQDAESVFELDFFSATHSTSSIRAVNASPATSEAESEYPTIRFVRTSGWVGGNDGDGDGDGEDERGGGEGKGSGLRREDSGRTIRPPVVARAATGGGGGAGGASASAALRGGGSGSSFARSSISYRRPPPSPAIAISLSPLQPAPASPVALSSPGASFVTSPSPSSPALPAAPPLSYPLQAVEPLNVPHRALPPATAATVAPESSLERGLGTSFVALAETAAALARQLERTLTGRSGAGSEGTVAPASNDRRRASDARLPASAPGGTGVAATSFHPPAPHPSSCSAHPPLPLPHPHSHSHPPPPVHPLHILPPAPSSIPLSRYGTHGASVAPLPPPPLLVRPLPSSWQGAAGAGEGEAVERTSSAPGRMGGRRERRERKERERERSRKVGRADDEPVRGYHDEYDVDGLPRRPLVLSSHPSLFTAATVRAELPLPPPPFRAPSSSSTSSSGQSGHTSYRSFLLSRIGSRRTAGSSSESMEGRGSRSGSGSEAWFSFRSAGTAASSQRTLVADEGAGRGEKSLPVTPVDGEKKEGDEKEEGRWGLRTPGVQADEGDGDDDGEEEVVEWTTGRKAVGCSVLSVFAYSLAGVICALSTYNRAWRGAEVALLLHPSVFAWLLPTSLLTLLTSLLGAHGTLLPSRRPPLLLLYFLLLVPCTLLLLLTASLSTRSFSPSSFGAPTVGAALDSAWARTFSPQQRASVQKALGCCGWYDAYSLAVYVDGCFPRSGREGCRTAVVQLEEALGKRVVRSLWVVLGLQVVNLTDLDPSFLAAALLSPPPPPCPPLSHAPLPPLPYLPSLHPLTLPLLSRRTSSSFVPSSACSSPSSLYSTRTSASLSQLSVETFSEGMPRTPGLAGLGMGVEYVEGDEEGESGGVWETVEGEGGIREVRRRGS
ncbi:hypothetical protein JCM6882_005212 [Rhodosporidiobolus microsporus]